MKCAIDIVFSSFGLDMGKPVKIADFAENFIRLSDFILHREIQINYKRLRPGEKLFEELFDKTGKVSLLPTVNS